MKHAIKVIVSGPKGSGKSAILHLIRNLLKVAKIEVEVADPQHALQLGDVASGQPYEVLNALKPQVLLVEDADRAYADFSNQDDLATFKQQFPSAVYVSVKKGFADRDHNIAYAAWCMGREHLRTGQVS